MKIPLFPLDAVLFPGAALPLHVFEERYKEMAGECLARKSVFGVVRAQSEGLAVIGCTARIARVLERHRDGRLDLLCQGVDRFEIEMLDESRAFLQAEVDLFEDVGTAASRARKEECLGLHFEILELSGGSAGGVSLDLDEPISFRLASTLPADLGFKQILLCLRSDAERTEQLVDYYSTLLPKLRRGAEATRSAIRNGHLM
ncbi:MAG TPA: LON peptidase substrate-binding domain-containing protein [Acidisarcina sp.]